MLSAGSKAPDFTLRDQAGQSRRLSELVRDEALILYFYPADFTPGCTQEACDLRDLHTQILSAGLAVIGVSPQSPESHARFREKYSLPFLLLSDEDKQVIKAYDVDGPLGFGVRRATFLIDSKLRIVDAVQADLRIGKHREFVEKAIAMKAGKPAQNLK